MENKQIFEKLDNIEKELIQLKIQLAGQEEKSKKKKKLASLKGILGDIRISDKEIEEAKKELFDFK